MNIKPVGHFVLVKLEEIEKKTKAGIILSTPKEEKRQQAGAQFARVIAVGPLAWKDRGDGEPWSKVGDRIITVRYPGAQFEYDDDELRLYRLINDDEVLAVIND